MCIRDRSPAPSAPSAPAVSGSDFYNITNISGNTAEGGTAATFKVALDKSPAPPAPSAPSVSGSDFYNITNISGNTAEDGTAATFKAALKSNAHFPSAPAAPPTNNHNKALEFDGTNDYVRVPNNTSLDMGEKLTMSAWVYPKDNGWSNIAMRGSYGYGFALSGNGTCGSSNRLVYWDQSSCGNSIYSTLTYLSLIHI